MQRNPKAQAIAAKRAIAKSDRIKLLNITPDLDIEAQDALVLKLANDKADVNEGTSAEDYVSGQEWYVKDLMTFSALDAQERFDLEYRQAFPEVASEDEVLDVIKAAM